MEFSEYVQLSRGGAIKIETYSYHCFDASGNLIIRWDNTPHFPDLPGFPHHVHTGSSEKPQPCKPMDLYKSLSEIKKLIEG